MGDVPTPAQLLAAVQATADHLELHDTYDRTDPAFLAWQTNPVRFVPEDWYTDWTRLAGDTTGRGVRIRRARVVSTPPSDYIMFEHILTPAVNLAAGEEVRWLARNRTGDIDLPADDFWLVDDHAVLYGYFDSEGKKTGAVLTTNPIAVAAARNAFNVIWARAVPHAGTLPV